MISILEDGIAWDWKAYAKWDSLYFNKTYSEKPLIKVRLKEFVWESQNLCAGWLLIKVGFEFEAELIRGGEKGVFMLLSGDALR